MDLIAMLHQRVAFNQRRRRLSSLLSEALAPYTRVLDVGCGDGQISRNLMRLNPGLEITGIDVLVRPAPAIPVIKYDGSRLPFDDDSFEAVMMVDVMHHTPDPTVLLAEARRVASELVVVKDHCRDGLLADSTLRLMDWVGNHRHGVALPYTYWPRARWEQSCADVGLTICSWQSRLDMYAPPLRPLFERKLHFMSLLAVRPQPIAPRRDPLVA